MNKRRETNANTLHAFLYHVIMDLIKEQNTAELESTLIWNTITNSLPGNELAHKPLSYDSSEFGTLSQKGIVETLIQVFGAKQSHNRREGRKLIFDLHKMQRLGQIYDLSVDVRVGTSVTDVTNVTHVGLDRHIYEQSTAKQNEDPNSKSSNADAIKNITHNNIASSNNYNDKLASLHPSQVSHPSQSTDTSTTTKIMNAKNSSIYRTSEHSDTFACQNCRLRGDRFYMEDINVISMQGNRD